MHPSFEQQSSVTLTTESSLVTYRYTSLGTRRSLSVHEISTQRMRCDISNTARHRTIHLYLSAYIAAQRTSKCTRPVACTHTYVRMRPAFCSTAKSTPMQSIDTAPRSTVAYRKFQIHIVLHSMLAHASGLLSRRPSRITAIGWKAVRTFDSNCAADWRAIIRCSMDPELATFAACMHACSQPILQRR